jgi:hypothetical protein
MDVLDDAGSVKDAHDQLAVEMIGVSGKSKHERQISRVAASVTLLLGRTSSRDQGLINEKLVDCGGRDRVTGLTPVSSAAVFQAAMNQCPMLRRICPQDRLQIEIRKSLALSKGRYDLIGSGS